MVQTCTISSGVVDIHIRLNMTSIFLSHILWSILESSKFNAQNCALYLELSLISNRRCGGKQMLMMN